MFGFNSGFDVESWEFLNNASDPCNFLAPIGDTWATDFEARYPDKHKDISRFKVMHDWVVSTIGDVEKLYGERSHLYWNRETHKDKNDFPEGYEGLFTGLKYPADI